MLFSANLQLQIAFAVVGIMSGPGDVVPVWEMAYVPEFWVQPHIFMDDINKIEPHRWQRMTVGATCNVGNEELYLPAPNGMSGALVKYFLSQSLNKAFVYYHCGEKHPRVIAREAEHKRVTLQQVFPGLDMALCVAVHSAIDDEIGMQHLVNVTPPWTMTIKQLKGQILKQMPTWTQQTQLSIVVPEGLKNGVTMKGVFGYNGMRKIIKHSVFKKPAAQPIKQEKKEKKETIEKEGKKANNKPLKVKK